MVTPATRLALDAVALSEDNQDQARGGAAPPPAHPPPSPLAPGASPGRERRSTYPFGTPPDPHSTPQSSQHRLQEKPHEAAVLDELAAACRERGFPGLADDRRLLSRFARTRNFDPVPTLPLLLEYGRWRARLRLDTLTWDDVRGEMAKKHTMRLPALGGDVENGPTARDAEGHPVIYKIQCNWRADDIEMIPAPEPCAL